MIEKKTVVDQIEITRNGYIQVRLGLLLVEDGKELSSAWHRTAIEPGGDVAAQMALVNAHLAQMGKTQCPASEIQRVKGVAALVHTPEVVAKFKADQKNAESVA